MRFFPSLLVPAVCLTLVAAAQTPAAPSVATRIAAQNAFFEAQYEQELKDSPLRATAYGDYRYNNQLGDFSLAHLEAENAADKLALAKLKAIDTAGFPEQDLLSHELMQRRLEQRIENFDLKNYEMSVNQQNGIHTSLSDLPFSVPLDTVQHYEDYIARLHQIPLALDQTTAILRLGIKDSLMPPRYLLEKVAEQASGIATASPFLQAIKKMPASFSDADRKRLTAEIEAAVATEVSPAYTKFATFIAEDYAPHGRTDISVASLPDGKHRYEVAVREQTTTSMTPAEIHTLGLHEIDRITAEMTAIAHKAGYPDLASFRAAINANPKYTPTSEEQILDTFRHYIAQMEPKLPQLFETLPNCPVTVEAIPAYRAAEATHYQTGTPDCKRPGRVSVGVSDYAHRSLINDEAIAYHEGVPGHHMQLSVQQQLTGLPKFRLHNLGFTAYTEGWALYAEQLGKDVGFYQDPVSDYGRLSSELFRAVRLVVDTGIHSQGWTRDQAVALFIQTDSLTGPELQSEVDRYIAWPGQALAYKIGQLKFLELRERAKQQLGAKFDLRAFNSEMLSGGSLPLDLLDQRTNRWIAAQLAAK